MTQNHIVDRLYTLVSKEIDIHRPNRFRVNITNRTSNDTLELLSSMIKSITIPSITVSNSDIRRFGRGFPIPGGINFSDITMTLYDDSKSLLRNYFTKWIQEYTKGGYDSHVFNSAGSFSNTNIEIIQLDRSFNKLSSHTLYYAFPSSIGELELSHDTVDEISTFTVAFKYSFFEYEKIDINTGNNVDAQGD